MSHQPFTAAALRGAVDLSSLKRPAQPAGPASGAASTSGDGAGLVIEGTDATIRDVIAASDRHPVVMVLWSPRLQESADFVASFGAVARRYAGRFQLVTVDVDANPTILQAFQVQAVPVSFAFVQSQPVPLFEGVQPEGQITAIIDQVLALAAQHGVTGTVAAGDVAAAADEVEQEQPLPTAAPEGLRRHRGGRSRRCRCGVPRGAGAEPRRHRRQAGLAQVGLLQRTQGSTSRRPGMPPRPRATDVDAQILVADLDLLGGHVEDAFLRLIDTVRVTPTLTATRCVSTSSSSSRSWA